MARQLIRTLLTACLLLGSAGALAAGNPDPWEGFNRTMFGFNEQVDQYVLKPAAKGYNAVIPAPARRSVGNFFGNLDDVGVLANNLMQGKGCAAGSDLVRILLNTTVGLFGLFDFATPLGFPKHEEDFGQTLAVWGMDTGNYVVLPFFGPRTTRSTVGLPVDMALDPVTWLEDDSARMALVALDTVDLRSGLLAGEEFITGDRYTFIRDGYLQRRDYLIRDGKEDENYVDPFLQ